MCVFSSALRPSENPCQTTRLLEKKQRVRGETWSERSRASWPRLEKPRASSKTTSPPSRVSDVPICRLRWSASCRVRPGVFVFFSDRGPTEHYPVPQRPAALGAGITDSGGDGLLWAGRPDRRRERSRKHDQCKSPLELPGSRYPLWFPTIRVSLSSQISWDFQIFTS